MTLDEANDAVGKNMDEVFDAIDDVLDRAPKDFMAALQRLYDARQAYFASLDQWAELDDAAKK